jgi:hypothetical protein
MVHWTNSYHYGVKQQQIVLPIIKEYFNRNIIEHTEQYAKYDFSDDIYNYELKSRTNNMCRFDTTMITLNKIDKSKPLILLFKFTDKLTYIEYDETLFNTFEIKQFSRAQEKYDMKNHIYIPIKYLTIIE